MVSMEQSIWWFLKRGANTSHDRRSIPDGSLEPGRTTAYSGRGIADFFLRAWESQTRTLDLTSCGRDPLTNRRDLAASKEEVVASGRSCRDVAGHLYQAHTTRVAIVRQYLVVHQYSFRCHRRCCLCFISL
jgi:hypothetical protein